MGSVLLLRLTLRLCSNISSVVLPRWLEWLWKQAWDQLEADVQYPLLLHRLNWKAVKGQAESSIVQCFMHSVTGCRLANTCRINSVTIHHFFIVKP